MNGCERLSSNRAKNLLYLQKTKILTATGRTGRHTHTHAHRGRLPLMATILGLSKCPHKPRSSTPLRSQMAIFSCLQFLPSYLGVSFSSTQICNKISHIFLKTFFYSQNFDSKIQRHQLFGSLPQTSRGFFTLLLWTFYFCQLLLVGS